MGEQRIPAKREVKDKGKTKTRPATERDRYKTR